MPRPVCYQLIISDVKSKVQIKTRELFKDENYKKMSECSAPASVLWCQLLVGYFW